MNRYEILLGKTPPPKKYPTIHEVIRTPDKYAQGYFSDMIISQESLIMLQQISAATSSIERDRAQQTQRNYQELNFSPGEFLTIRMIFMEHGRQQTMANRIDMFHQREIEYRNMYIRDVRERMLRAVLERFQNSNIIPEIRIYYEIE